MPTGIYTRTKTGRIISCANCGGLAYRYPSDIERANVLFCSIECSNRGKKGIAPITAWEEGHIPWNKNKKGVMPEPWNKNKKGIQTAWNKGKKSPWVSRRNRENNPMNNPETRRRVGLSHRGMKKPKVSESNRRRIGEKAGNWRGGLTSLVLQIRHCPKYHQWRSGIFMRDNFTCQFCKVKGGRLEVDHYPKTFSHIFYKNKIQSREQAIDCEEFWDMNNGRTLCRKCHKSWIR